MCWYAARRHVELRLEVRARQSITNGLSRPVYRDIRTLKPHQRRLPCFSSPHRGVAEVSHRDHLSQHQRPGPDGIGPTSPSRAVSSSSSSASWFRHHGPPRPTRIKPVRQRHINQEGLAACRSRVFSPQVRTCVQPCLRMHGSRLQRKVHQPLCPLPGHWQSAPVSPLSLPRNASYRQASS